MSFFKQTLARSVAFLFIGLFIAALGVRAFTAMPRSLFPEINYPRVVVEVNMGFTPLQVMEWSVTSILEKELRAVPGVRLVKSSSSRGLSTIDVFLRESEEITLAVQRVNAKIAEVRALLPATAQISVRPITAAAFPAAEYCFSSPTQNSSEMRQMVEYTLKPMILVVPGIFDVKVLGGDQPEFSVELDSTQLAKHNLSVADINDRLKNSNSVDFLGPLETDDKQILAFGGRFVKSTRDIENIVVDSSLGHAIRIGDLGQVRLKNQYKTKNVSLDENECVGLDIFYQAGIDQNQTSTQVARILNDVAGKKLHATFRSWDLNDFTDAATNAVLLDLAVGMLIIALVTQLFLRNFRYSLIALLVMPLAASFTFLAMSYFGLSINLMTLGGLTAAIGLVVDNTVIVLEMYDHRKNLLETLSSVVKPMVFGTLTIALVFTPISYLSGVSGMFFAPMAHVHSAALVVSVLLALFIVPGLILIFDRKREDKKPDHFDHGKLARGYASVLNWSMKRGKLFVWALLAVPLLGLIVLPFAQTGFLPEWDEGDIVIDFRATSPMSLNATVQKVRPIEEYLKSVPEIDFFIRKVGTGLGEYNKLPYVGEIVLKLKKHRARSVFQIKDQLSQEIDKLGGGLEFDLFQILPDRLNDLSGSAKPIVLYLHGDDAAKMDEASQIYKTALSQVKGLDSVRIEEPEKAAELLFDLNEQLSRALDLNPTAVNEVVKFGLFSIDSSSVQVGPQSIPIRLRSLKKAKDLPSIAIFSSKGGLEQIGRLGKIEEVKSRVESSHLDGAPVRTLTAELAGRDLGSVIKDLQLALKQVSVPGVYAELAGDYQMQQQSFRELMLAFLTGLVLIFITSLLFSNRLRVALPLTICSIVPPAVGLVGCVLGKIPLDVSSFSGLISVTGISVANAFMALSAIEALPEHLQNPLKSVRAGMLSRLRPILMTNLAAMAGFVPIAIGLASGDEILKPFSIAVIVGLFGAVYTTLILVPLFYSHYAVKDTSCES